jgi:hypothetical protein
MKKQPVLEHRILKELTDLNSANAPLITTRFNNAKITFKDNILAIFIHIYTSDLMYKQFNEVFARQQYYKIMHITAMCVVEAKAQAEKIKPNEVLYRGLNCEVTDIYKVGETMYWPAFSSCSSDVKQSVLFAQGKKACLIFEIRLSKTNPHPHLRIPKEWSAYPTEAEVLLLPYFALKVISIKIGAEQKPPVNYDHVLVEQDESKSVLSFDEKTIQKHWKNVFDNVEKSVLTFFTEMRDRIPESVKLTRYFSGPFIDEIKLADLNSDIDDYISLCLENLLQLSKEQVLKDKAVVELEKAKVLQPSKEQVSKDKPLIELEEMIQVLYEKIDFDYITTNTTLYSSLLSNLKDVLKKGKVFTDVEELKSQLKTKIKLYNLAEVEKDERDAFVQHLQNIETFFLGVVKSELFSNQ